MRNGCFIFIIFTAAVIITGCGPKPGDKLMKDKIELLNNMAAEFEKVTDKASMAKAGPEVISLGQKLDQVEKEFAALPQEAQDAAKTAHKAELDTATARYATAKDQARAKAMK